jgi:hypothetical protein
MDDQTTQYQQLIAKAWADEGFKQRLLSDPVATMKAEGIDVPAGVAFHAVEDTETRRTLVIPPQPTELSEQDLAGVVGGYYSFTNGRSPW